MRTLLLFLTFILLSNANAQETINFRDSSGRKQGHWIYYGTDRPDSGVPADGKVEEGNYLDDRKEGLWIKYHEDGVTPKLKGEYKNNRPTSRYIKSWENGQTKEIGCFEKNIQMDSLKRFYENGQLEYEAWFNQYGKEEGLVNLYYKTGQLEHTYCAKNGVAYDAYHYDLSGKQTSSQPTPIICTTKPRDIQPVTPEEAAKHPLPTTSETPNTRDQTFKPNGYNKVYNADNEILFDGVYKEGQLLDGKYYEYDRDGILLTVRIYKNGVYHSEGQL